MSTVNFSVPDDVKAAFNAAFNATFEGQNKSAVIADLMREAVERAHQKTNSQAAYLRILERRKHAPSMTRRIFVLPVKKVGRDCCR
ncbi:hypothetical protein HC248_02070 [Polaromonas vacuolata]|uniref:Uncharacterized protein n=1 Tax=Polaromonas vacuolata TaxID=37448 RepID=A0A6H2HAA8_9BURK|nr:hypothetical protein [Polaromonas vacuolata]QJC56760.1 hypothetical protein HC248_02070 [Polaromonas vacuolata]